MQQSSLSNAEQQIKKAQSELEKLKREIVQVQYNANYIVIVKQERYLLFGLMIIFWV